MAKELPYFKFHINEWFNGDITLEDYELQGIFVNICAYYWSKDCNLSKPNLLKKFRGHEDKIHALITSSIIKISGENIRISFLNEQYGSKEVQKIANRQNGLLGGRPPKQKTEEKPNGLNFDNPNITNIEERKGKKSILNKEIIYSAFIDLFKKQSGKNIRVLDKKAKTQLLERIKEGYTSNDFIAAINNCKNNEHHIQNPHLLTPEFITRGDKLTMYVGSPVATPLPEKIELWQQP